MVDYSKWDKFVDSDEEEGDVLDYRSLPPNVTAFNESQRVTIGPQGYFHEPQNSGMPPDSELNAMTKPLDAPSLTKGPTVKQPKKTSGAEDWSKDGAMLDGYAWSQDKENAVLRIFLPENTKAKNIAVEISEDKQLESTLPKLSIKESSSGKTLFSGTFAYPIEMEEGEGMDAVDWELVSEEGRRIMKMALRKKLLIANCYMYWKKAFQSEDEIDTRAIENKVSNFGKAWDEAHEMFRQKVREDIDRENIDP
jgi:hypothetical protein